MKANVLFVTLILLKKIEYNSGKKVSQAFRDALDGEYKSSSFSKKKAVLNKEERNGFVKAVKKRLIPSSKISTSWNETPEQSISKLRVTPLNDKQYESKNMVQTNAVFNQPIIAIGSSLYEKILFGFSSSSARIDQTREALKIENDDCGCHKAMVDDLKKHRLSEANFARIVREEADKNKNNILTHDVYGDNITDDANISCCENTNSVINALRCYHNNMSKIDHGNHVNQ